MDAGYTKEWIRFFTNCGIPDNVATMYALTFTENRIQKNMLPDLNKEYLKEMGITVMGDVIAILRHAKIAHEEHLREKVLLGSEKMIPIVKNIVIDEATPKKSTPMKRMLEHYTRKYESVEVEPLPGKVQIEVQNKKSTISKKLGPRIGLNLEVRKKITAPSPEHEIQLSSLEVPVPKVRRVLPENEGRYKIKMPSGNTERSKKILVQAKKRQSATVFDRLGESSVSSTTCDVGTVSLGTKIPESNLVLSKQKNLSSVFARLGEKTSLVTSTSSIEEVIVAPEEQLPYAGILKSSTSEKKGIKTAFNTTMRADNERLSKGVKKSVDIDSLKGRLGTSTSTKSTSKTDPKRKKPLLDHITITTDLKKRGDHPVEVITVYDKVKDDKRGTKSVDNTSNSAKRFDNFVVQPKRKNVTVVHSTKNTVSDTGTQKRKRTAVDDNELASDNSPTKKVRFGKITHRLIPGNATETKAANRLKNYPNLTMMIENEKNVKKDLDNPRLSSGVKVGSLTSDVLVNSSRMKERIGKKSVQERLGQRNNLNAKLGSLKLGTSSNSKKSSNVHDRLG